MAELTVSVFPAIRFDSDHNAMLPLSWSQILASADPKPGSRGDNFCLTVSSHYRCDHLAGQSKAVADLPSGGFLLPN